MEKFADLLGFNVITRHVNTLFANKEPWQIASITATTVFTSMWLWELFWQDEGLIERTRKPFFRMLRKIPAVKKKIDKEIARLQTQFDRKMQEGTEDMGYYCVLPAEPLDDAEILNKIDDYLALGEYNWQNGKVSGAVYNYDQKLVNLVTNVYGKTSYTNPLHSDLFPGICKMEAEVVRMMANLFNGDSEACGTMTSGGTESIIMACKAYRDYARDVKGIAKPNIIMSRTAHSGFDKAAQYLGLYVKYIPIDPITTCVDIRKMKRAINSNTIMLVGSAPNFPYGTIDDIKEIGALGVKYNIPVHVDACLGGFLIVFMEKAGYSIKPYDFRVKGVTSISADSHKYGFAPKGTSIILYSNQKYRNHQYTVTTDWPGGVYGSPTVSGSRAGGVIATCWATMLSFGENGYIEATKRIVAATKYIEEQLRDVNGIFIFGTPATSVVAIGSKTFDIFLLLDYLKNKGWNLNALQFPSGLHICVTYMHTKNGLAQQFVEDVRNGVVEIMKNPNKPLNNKLAVYGMAQSLPDRGLVGDFTRCFLNAMYSTPQLSASQQPIATANLKFFKE